MSPGILCWMPACGPAWGPAWGPARIALLISWTDVSSSWNLASNSASLNEAGSFNSCSLLVAAAIACVAAIILFIRSWFSSCKAVIWACNWAIWLSFSCFSLVNCSIWACNCEALLPTSEIVLFSSSSLAAISSAVGGGGATSISFL